MYIIRLNILEENFITCHTLFVKNISVSLSFTLAVNEKVERYIKIKIHKLIALRFWIESDVNVLCGWTHVLMVLCLPVKPPLLRSYQVVSESLVKTSSDECKSLY